MEFMRHLLRFLVCSLLFVGLAGCTPEATVSKEAGDAVIAYNDFITQLKACGTFKDEKDPKYTRPSGLPECDKEKIYEALDSQTKNELITAYVTLVKMDDVIENYFEDIEHKYMRSKTGTDILKNPDRPIKNNKDLFMYLFKPENIIFNENVISGLTIEKDIVRNPNLIELQTHMSGQSFIMVKEADGVWRTSVLANYVAAAVDPIMFSSNEMTEHAKGNLEAEYNRRAAVRSYFIKQQEVRRRQYEESLLNKNGAGNAQPAVAEPAEEAAPEPEESADDAQEIEAEEAEDVQAEAQEGAPEESAEEAEE